MPLAEVEPLQPVPQVEREPLDGDSQASYAKAFTLQEVEDMVTRARASKVEGPQEAKSPQESVTADPEDLELLACKVG